MSIGVQVSLLGFPGNLMQNGAFLSEKTVSLNWI